MSDADCYCGELASVDRPCAPCQREAFREHDRPQQKPVIERVPKSRMLGTKCSCCMSEPAIGFSFGRCEWPDDGARPVHSSSTVIVLCAECITAAKFVLGGCESATMAKDDAGNWQRVIVTST